MKIVVVIAAYNEAGTIGPLTVRLIRALDSLPGATWRLIYVIEGSDGTVDIAREYARQRPEIEILFRESPSGLGRAFRTGFDAVPGDTDVVVTMDADLNHQPEEIARLVDALAASGADIVVGSRRLGASRMEGVPAWKRILSRIVNEGMRILMRVPVKDMTSGFRVYQAQALRRLGFRKSNFAFLPEILIIAAAQGMKVIEEPIRFTFREVGESKMSLPITGLSYVKLFAQHALRRRLPGEEPPRTDKPLPGR